MRRVHALPLLAAVQVLGAGVSVDAPAPLLLVGGDSNDHAFARLAAGLHPGGSLAPEALPLALEAIRATDRFRKVTGTSGRIELDPWPALARIRWDGDPPGDLRKKLFPGLHPGERLGNLRLEVLRSEAQATLAGAGYPRARVRVAREDGDRILAITVEAGPADRIQEVVVQGHSGPFRSADLLKASGIRPGVSLWCRRLELASLAGLRKKLVGKKYYEGRAELAWDGHGKVTITVEAGPSVLLRTEGPVFRWYKITQPSIGDMVPLTRAERYAPDLLEEGDRRLVRFFRSKGYLDPQVTHRRDILETGPDGPVRVAVTYRVEPGRKTLVNALRFEGNQAVPADELRRAAGLRGESMGAMKARPEVLDSVEDKVTAYYQARGYAEVKVHRRLEPDPAGTALVLRIREGQRQMVGWLRLELPAGGMGDPWGLGECLPLFFSDKVVLEDGTSASRRYRSDRPEFAGLDARLAPDARDGRLWMTLAFSRPIPLTKADLFRVYTAIRQAHLVSLGVLRPVVRVQVASEEGGLGVRFEVPDQPLQKVERLVVQGCDRTRAKAVERELSFGLGDPLDLDKISKAQGNLGTLGAFGRMDFLGLGEVPELAGPKSPWTAGDLMLRTEERSPWVLTHAFGYDRTQGYYIGTGVERLNVGGMGRIVDLDVRAGDGLLKSRTLSNIFATGAYNESLDSISLAYTDPWFQPGILEDILPDRTTFRTEGAYIQEQRYVYSVHRRRFLASLRWNLPAHLALESGLRWERQDVSANVAGFTDQELADAARYPAYSVVSAPYLQVVRDTRDNAFDPTSGMYSLVRFESALQAFGTSPNSSFLKLDLRNQWTWPVGFKAGAGVVSLGVRAAVARPTASTSQQLPLAERFFAGGSGSHRGVEPQFLGPLGFVPYFDMSKTPPVKTDQTEMIPLGGQALVLLNLEYRFPISGQTVWGELFCDSGQVYERLKDTTLTTYDEQGQPQVQTLKATFPALRTALGVGLIFKLGIPLKLEYAADVNRIWGRPRSDQDRNTQLRHLMVSAGFQF